MAEQSTTEEESKPSQASGRLPWVSVAILAVLALLGGIALGRVAFVTGDDPAPRVVSIEIEDDDLEVGGNVEYFEDQEVYILTIRTMPPPDDGQVYAVWLQTDDVIVCAGVLNPDSAEFAYAAYSGRYETLFVTEEPGPYCGDQPTSSELITADFTELEDEDD